MRDSSGAADLGMGIWELSDLRVGGKVKRGDDVVR